MTSLSVILGEAAVGPVGHAEHVLNQHNALPILEMGG